MFKVMRTINIKIESNYKSLHLKTIIIVSPIVIKNAILQATTDKFEKWHV